MGSRHVSRHALDAMAADALRHPIRAAEREAEHLRDLANEGESAATPLILIATWILVAALLVSLAVTLAFVVAHVVTR
jgi:hypothetical protein